ncbi:MAG: DMT family transporter [Chloroflexi bacterium]|nr:DMT family transporter [Chloroflexota bacterium]
MIGELAGLACAALWATISLMMRAVADRMPATAVNGMRCAIAASTLFLILLVSGRLDRLATMPQGTIIAIVVSGVVGQAVGDALFVASAKLIGASRALPLSGASPLLTVGLAIAFFGEQLPALALLGAVLVVGGVYLLATPVSPFRQVGFLAGADKRGLLLALVAAVCWSFSTLILRDGIGEVDLMAANTLRLVVATISLASLEIVMVGPRIPKGLDRRAWALMLPAGAMSAFSSLMYLTSVYYAGAAKASVINATSPLFGLPLALLFLHERISRRVVFGTGLCVLGLWLVLWR